MRISEIIENDDIQLFIDRLIVGSKTAWREFIEIYHPVISGTIKKHSSNLDVDDISQKVYLRCIKDDYELLRNFKGNSKIAFKKYIAETAKFIVWDERSRYQKKNSKFADSEEILENVIASEPSPDMQYESAELSNIVSNAIMKLELNQREVLYFLLQGMTHREIAQIMGRPLNTVLSWSNRAKIKLKNILKSEKILQ
ncbi:sigma-70 family RNA polymerase sigma factor [Leptospira meyeri]|uniref:RNA polymerase sigma factor n=1 Tax=Leptospira meyeri TaxID=29508 RepID=UPI0010845654|nr:sigma-70 family RNA polymerase sigma factor [Leptospira meyeri]TGM66142.1 sigma-70 family RNA polymerase sigma factor [Leptospira meyeri]